MNHSLPGFQEVDPVTLGLNREPAPWENGLRTEPQRRGYERWTVNALYEGGIRVTLRFSTRRQQVSLLPSNPTVSIDITLPDGTGIHRSFSEGSGRAIAASREYCSVNVSGSYLRMAEGGYEVYYVDDQVEFNSFIRPRPGPWRPGSGVFSPDGGRTFFGWMVPVPRGDAESTLRLKDGQRPLSGDAVIDHFWTNGDIGSVADHWYLCRAIIGDYTAISLDLKLRASEEARATLLYLARDREVLLDGSGECAVSREETFIHPNTKTFYDGRIRFSVGDYAVTHSWVKDYEQSSGPRILTALLKRLKLRCSTLVSHSDVSLELPGVDPMGGIGIMEQVSFTDLPQARPEELLASQWPEEPEDAEEIEESAEALEESGSLPKTKTQA